MIHTQAAVVGEAGSSLPAHELRIGDGLVVLDPRTGAPVAFVDPAAPERRFLLDSSVAWHSIEHGWGSGFMITTTGAFRWNAPTKLTGGDGIVEAHHSLDTGVELTVTRRGGDTYEETYVFSNTSDVPVTITGLSIQTPYADLYEDAHSALNRAVHAHIFTGGAWAWVLAQPMSGAGRCLGLVVRDGELWSYSIESRNAATSSNIRGHIVLNVTDRTRSAHAFGGQPDLVIAPGEEYRLQWELTWYESAESFIAATGAPAEFSRYTALVGEEIQIRTNADVRVDSDTTARSIDGGVAVSSNRSGTHTVEIGGGRTEVLFHEPVAQTVKTRAEYILRYQRASERPGTLSGALLPVDTSTKLTQTGNGWADWTDGSERIGMALLIQRALKRNLLGTDAQVALDRWAAFAREHLLDDTLAPWRGSQHGHGSSNHRLYDSPWLAEFFAERAALTGDAANLDIAAGILRRAIQLGILHFLAIGLAGAIELTSRELDRAGRRAEADSLRQSLVESAHYFHELGQDLPAHEVAYEQSMVAPLIELFSAAHRISGDRRFADAAAERLPWLLAFGGPQPHARLHGIAIRHWDGYWFGLRRQWGDIFPHHWSALTATALARLPEQLKTPDTHELALRIMHANMSNYFPDGSATAAFIFPSSIDGAAAHAADPLANDQDWHLASWLRLDDDMLLPID
ncbi:MAG TPA: hypothetical protein VN045_02640 [Microbacteriaceae bacterium]|nr:hypothetical protein [Microbacteriaceae bacterium]